MKLQRHCLLLLTVVRWSAMSNEVGHSHPAPEQLGTVGFETSCNASVQKRFERAVALLHSFAYDAAATEFAAVAASDATCAMAHWGLAMSLFHQLWSPPSAADLQRGQQEIALARRIGSTTERERAFIDASAVYFANSDPKQHAARATAYAAAMEGIAKRFSMDVEAQVFYALALIAIAPPTAREQLGELLLQLGRPAEALPQLEQALKDAPGRRAALEAAARAADETKNVGAAAAFRQRLLN